ncbi:MAG: aminotransferase class I/II-fold pyridoxal phosphate-dependent enzyme [Treponema sp.]|uniref:aminotransferase class I/II-fold pyridoxal phosphate-dependent enzyme n=1 Tax=Treponema sp. TaxID=166 RepID=UPI0025F27CD5|nr:aminotransferase class I/II-fold pyridoxal phosphate-dependent enzyme [Treponema sp.]MBR0495163.1 aminotransferase class I/II-fold pyridoxal phosphate-dependent enzyme [Treponema sp.]
MLNPLAQELNDTLRGTVAGELLSDLGTRIFFPRGIISQGGEAKQFGKVANATIGTTMIEGKPAALPSVKKFAPELTNGELVAYTPTAGNPDLRKKWKELMLKKNPGLAGKATSNPVVVPGLTAGISYLSDLFVDTNHPLLAANPSWDNYSLVVETRRGAELHTFNMFRPADDNNGGFDIDSFKKAMEEEAKSGSVRVLLNFPQNPSGYSPTNAEAKEIVQVVKELAEKGTKIIVWDDDAYFGLNYEEDIYPQSLFAEFADLHENVLAVKVDGPTKEDFVWGFRCGFLTFAGKGISDEQYLALEKKLMGLIRSSVSCSSSPSQSISLKAFSEPKIEEEKKAFRDMLCARYKKVRAFVDTHKSSVLEALPFNSGYFMSFHTECNAEELRLKILHEKQIGTISIDESTLRVAFSSVDESKIDQVYSAIYAAAEEMK